MNREIKFRGKRIDNGEWIYGSYAKCCESDGYIGKIGEVAGDDIKFNGILVDTKMVCEYTGRKDKNQKEIYEFDYVEIQTLEDMGERIDKQYGLIIYEPEALQYLLLTNKGEKLLINPYGIFTKLGNKFDNPELLEK